MAYDKLSAAIWWDRFYKEFLTIFIDLGTLVLGRIMHNIKIIGEHAILPRS